MDYHIQMLKLCHVEDFKCMYARFDFMYYENDTHNKYEFNIFWDNDNNLPVLYYKYEYYVLQLPQHNEPITVFQVLQYLGIRDISISIEYSGVHIISEWNTELTDEIMRSTIKYGHYLKFKGYGGNYKYRLQSIQSL